jgi:hypothetical protein
MMKILFYFHDENLRIIGKEVREFVGHFDQEFMVVYMNPEKPWLNYASRRVDDEAQFNRELGYAGLSP